MPDGTRETGHSGKARVYGGFSESSMAAQGQRVQKPEDYISQTSLSASGGSSSRRWKVTIGRCNTVSEWQHLWVCWVPAEAPTRARSPGFLSMAVVVARAASGYRVCELWVTPCPIRCLLSQRVVSSCSF
ncbi:hypothetical protein VULLAG_LOCUS3501 [Vulpes lagopus]